MRHLTSLFIALFALAIAAGGGADPTHCAPLQHELPVEMRVREIAQNMRCPVCQGQSVYDSNSDLARQMKAVIREKLQAGETPSGIVNFFKARYGDYVLMAPPRKGFHWAIWIAPILLILLGASTIVWRTLHQRRRTIDEAEGKGTYTEMEQLEL